MRPSTARGRGGRGSAPCRSRAGAAREATSWAPHAVSSRAWCVAPRAGARPIGSPLRPCAVRQTPSLAIGGSARSRQARVAQGTHRMCDVGDAATGVGVGGGLIDVCRDVSQARCRTARAPHRGPPRTGNSRRPKPSRGREPPRPAVAVARGAPARPPAVGDFPWPRPGRWVISREPALSRRRARSRSGRCAPRPSPGPPRRSGRRRNARA